MSSAGAGSAAAGEGAGAGLGAGLHALSFKLRFAAQREPGRSYVSLVKPRDLPATVTGKFYSREEAPRADCGDEGDTAECRALRRIQDMFSCGPRERLAAPRTESHEYGWWVAEARRAEPRLRHHIRDSAWLKARLLVLAADDRLKRK